VPRRYCRGRNQSGYVLVLSVILLGLFLSLAAAAIDMGNLYVWQLRLDKAVRAGALAGLGYRSMQGWTAVYGGAPYVNGTSQGDKLQNPGAGMTSLINEADAVVRSNFQVSFPGGTTSGNGGTNELASLTATNRVYNPLTDQITLTYQYQVPTFFAGRLASAFGSFPTCGQPGPNARCTITSTQTAQLDYANIVMLLDVSGSMTPQINQLRASAQQFSQLFNPFRDRISVIPFNLGAQVAFSFQTQGNGQSGAAHQASFGRDAATWTAFNNAISGLTPQSNTNPCDALLWAMSELDSLRSQRGVATNAMRPFVVFFTDGAPNAFRGSFSNMINQGQNGNPAQGTASGWYQYALEWVTGPPRTTYQGPSPLVSAQTSLFNLVPTALTSAPDPATFARNNPYCGDIWSSNDANSPTYFERALNGSLDAGSRRPGCLTDLSFSLPNGYDSVISLPARAQNETAFRVGSTQKFHELPYYCAIEATDQIRTTYNGTVFAIGLGPASTNPQCDDPLQDPTDHFTRKDNFLSRLAFDPYTYDSNGWKAAFSFSPRRLASLTGGCARGAAPIPVGYDLSVDGRPPAPRTPAQLSGTEGQYYPTSNPNDLPFLFGVVAKQILLRLNS
jgi:hypothetical protein